MTDTSELMLTPNQEKVRQAIAEVQASGGRLSGKAVARHLGLNDDRNVRAVWDRLHQWGLAPERPRRAGAAPKETAGRARRVGWDGGKSNPGRAAELRRRRVKAMTADQAFLHLVKVQETIAQLASVLETVRMSDYGADEVSLWHINDLHDDLIRLGEWHDRTLSAVQNRLATADIRKKISILRNPIGRTPGEAAAMSVLADRLERKLNLILPAGS
jgi:hypothetical protein